MNLNIMLINMFFIISCLMFSYFYKHLLLTLITLEFIMLNMTLMLYLYLFYTKLNLLIMSLFLTMMICESILGLCLLIFMVRSNGNDYLKSLLLMN